MPDDVMERSAKLLDGITPEPWTIRYSEKGIVAVVNEEIKFFIAVLHPDDVGTDIGSANVAFIAAAPDLVRELCAEVEKLRALDRAGNTVIAAQAEAGADTEDERDDEWQGEPGWIYAPDLRRALDGEAQ